MLSLLFMAKNAIQLFRGREEAQDAFEYLLVIGLVMVAVVLAIVSGIVPEGIESFVGAVIDKVTGLVTGDEVVEP